MVSFSVRVRRQVVAAMKETGESRLGLAEKTGIARPTLNRSLDGHRPFNTDELSAIAKALNIPLADLVQGVAA
jgi:lambda repressor-like predicted transcriptional regulator